MPREFFEDIAKIAKEIGPERLAQRHALAVGI